MAKKTNKNFSIDVMPENVLHTSISTSKDDYNHARMIVKVGDKQYMSIGFEWQGNMIPDFALDLMDFMKNNNVETSGVWPEQEEAYTEYSAKMKKEEVCSECGKNKEECTCKKED